MIDILLNFLPNANKKSFTSKLYPVSIARFPLTCKLDVLSPFTRVSVLVSKICIQSAKFTRPKEK